METQSTRQLIIEQADQLFYQQGFEHTSFANIAEKIKISRGNFYHHFKSKDEILKSVIEYRLHATQQMLEKWQDDDLNPDKRIRSFINILIMNQTKIKLYGCPVGTLCSELSKLQHSLSGDASGLFTLFRRWLTTQFQQLGFAAKSDELAMHVLARSQGIAVMANAFQDASFIKQEVELLNSWLTHRICDEVVTH